MPRLPFSPTILPALAFALPLAAGGDPAFRLPPLGEAERMAGVSQGHAYYTADRIRSHWYRRGGVPPLARYTSPYPETLGLEAYGAALVRRSRLAPYTFADLHREGHLMPGELLAECFFNSVFQYNVRHLTGLHAGYNYSQLPGLMPGLNRFERNLVLDLCGFLDLLNPETAEELAPLLAGVEALERANRSWRRNALLQRLGIAFMRQKIVVEKLAKAVARGSSPEQREARHQITLARDRLVQDLQTMIFHLMQEGFAAFAVRVKAADPARKAGAGAFLAEFRPAFMAQPYYEKIDSYLEEYGLATVLVHGIPLAP